jgi:hypothetical protein
MVAPEVWGRFERIDPMRITRVLAALGLTLSAAPALAWGDMGHGYVNQFIPTTNEVAIWAYPTKHNYCPAGLQPVSVGGVICCGTPTHTGYQSHPVVRHRPAPVVQYSKDYVVQGSKSYMGN